MSFSVLWLPLVISAVLFMPFGAFFYSEKGLGKQWMKAIGKTREDIEKESKNMGLLMGSTVLISLATVFIYAVLVASIGITTFVDLLLLSVFFYLIIFLVRLKNSLFDGNMALFKVNLIGTAGEMLITFVVFLIFL